MFTAKTIATDHKDLIHDVSYDFYGKRMATCSSDQSVKVRVCGCALNRIAHATLQVWDLSEGGQWRCTASWKVSVTKASPCISGKQPSVLSSLDALGTCMESDMGAPGVWSSVGHVLI